MRIYFLLFLLPFSSPHPNGAPAHVCQSMAPFHSGGILPQDSSSPYIVTPSVTELPEDQTLRLTLGSRQGLTFQGFMIQGRTSLAQDAVGVFRRIPTGTKHLNCKGENDTVTHSNTNNKGVIEFEWVPPKGYRGDIIFNATIAQGYQTFWQGVQSPIVRVVRSSGSSPADSQNFYSGCGFTSLCFGAPLNCEKSQNCKAASKVTVQNGVYTFEMMGPKESNYVAVGLSDDDRMGEDSVMECVRNKSRIEEFMSVTHGKTAPQRLDNPKQGIKLVDFNTENGQIYCKLTRDTRTTVDGRLYDLDKEQYHLLIATGTSVQPTKVGFHDIAYLPTPQKLTLSDPNPPKTTTPPNFIPTTDKETAVVDDPFYTGCFSTKGCFGAPDGCIRTKNCKVVVATTVRGEQYIFEIMAPREAKYVAVGLSDDAQMGDDSVVECVNEGNNGVKAYMSKTNPRPSLGVDRLAKPKEGIQLLEGRATDGSVYCKVQRDVRTVVNGRTYDLVNDQYVQLVVAGPDADANGVGYHKTAYLAAGEKRYLSDVSELGAASKILIRLHGAFMLAAWVGTASVGILLARYYRQTWVGSQICGKDLWFFWHRFFMVCTWALTTVAFVLIFVELKAWSTERNPHAILGMVTTIICFLQPIGAFFRPHPGTPKRPIFNWLHWLGGNVAHILGIVTIFFAVKLNKAELPEWMDWILVGYVAFHVLIHLILSILGCLSDRAAESRVTSFPMKDLGVNGRSSHSFERNADAPKSGARRILLFIYLLVIICFVAALIVITVMAPIEETWKKLRESMNS